MERLSNKREKEEIEWLLQHERRTWIEIKEASERSSNLNSELLIKRQESMEVINRLLEDYLIAIGDIVLEGYEGIES